MSVVIETTLGDITIDLYLNERPMASLNFLKLCKLKYYNFNLFHTISRGFIAQTGDPTGTRTGGESIYGVINGPSKRYFEPEKMPKIKHTRTGLISFVGDDSQLIGSQFFFTLGEDLNYLDDKHCVFGEVTEGLDILEAINEVICDNDDRPYQDVRISHTVILDDPYPDPIGLMVPSRSPSPSAERLAGGRIAPDEDIDETSGKTAREIAELQAEREAKARATILEMVGDIPDAEMAPPENVLFVCKLNPVTTDDDLEIIFSRFGKIKSCEVIRDRKTGDSLQYAFIEFEEQKSCEDAYFKMANVLIDDRRIHVDFSQSVAKVKWLGKGRGVAHYDDKGNKRKDGGGANEAIGKGDYKSRREDRSEPRREGGNNGDRSDRRHERYRRSPAYERTSSRREYDRRYHSYERSSRSHVDKRSRSPRKRSNSRSRGREISHRDREERATAHKSHRERESRTSYESNGREKRHRSEYTRKEEPSQREKEDFVKSSSDKNNVDSSKHRKSKKEDEKTERIKQSANMEKRKISKKKRKQSTSSDSSSSSSSSDSSDSEKDRKRKKRQN